MQAVVARNRHCGRLVVFSGWTIDLESRDSGFDAILMIEGCKQYSNGVQ